MVAAMQTPPKHLGGHRMITCRECGRERYHSARGLCYSCYKRLLHNGDLVRHEPIRKRAEIDDLPVEETGDIIICRHCGERCLHQARGLCGPCYSWLSRRDMLDKYPKTRTRQSFRRSQIASNELLAALKTLLSDGKPHTRIEACRVCGISPKHFQTLLTQAEKAGLLLYEDRNEIGLLSSIWSER